VKVPSATRAAFDLLRPFVQEPVLGIETTGTLTGAALFLHGRLQGEIATDARSGAAESLLDSVQRLLESHSLRVRDLRRIGIALGPGSFTGVRVGLAAGRALASGGEVAVVGVPSHETLAWSWRGLARTIVLLTGMRRGQVFFEAGEWHGPCWKASIPARNVPVSSVGELLSSLAPVGELLLVGEAVQSVGQACPGLRGAGIEVPDPLATVRRPGVVACLAARSEAEERKGPELEGMEPLYLRDADARRPERAG
jgi:tRNA threonylcarbamoyladenosine biosynthesis protein TsaB